ncbi:serine hydrolase domain-containing protein [Terriglobus albidus]|nr:serine hydrolase [Terriglobus albidus]
MRSIALLVLVMQIASAYGQTTARLYGNVVPQATWQEAKPEAAGYSGEKLEALRGWLKVQDTESMMVIVQGRVIFSYGDVAHVSKIASVRKSIVGMLYGNYVVANKIDLYKTVTEVGLQESTPFLPIESHATLEQLLEGRSGIYTDPDDTLPRRGSEYPGTYFVYQNWDFNAAGTAFEKLAGKGIYETLGSDLATPLGMQDFDLKKQHKFPSTGSVHPEYAMYLSTRDMARLGLLMLDFGVWNGKNIIPSDWVRYMTSLTTSFKDMHPDVFQNAGEPERWGFGATWWVWDQPAFPGSVYSGFMQGAYSAMGTGGTFITVLPAKNMVVVHKVDIDRSEHATVSPSSYIAMLTMIANSYCGDSCSGN